MGTVAALLAVCELLAILWGSSTLGARANAAVGVVGLGVIGAGNMVAFGDTTGIIAIACIKIVMSRWTQLQREDLSLTVIGTLGLGGQSHS